MIQNISKKDKKKIIKHESQQTMIPKDLHLALPITLCHPTTVGPVAVRIRVGCHSKVHCLLLLRRQLLLLLLLLLCARLLTRRLKLSGLLLTLVLLTSAARSLILRLSLIPNDIHPGLIGERGRTCRTHSIPTKSKHPTQEIIRSLRSGGGADDAVSVSIVVIARREVAREHGLDGRVKLGLSKRTTRRGSVERRERCGARRVNRECERAVVTNTNDLMSLRLLHS